MRRCSSCATKSNSTSSTSSPYGIADVPNPRAVTYSGTFHQWFCSGVSTIRVFPTICVHMCSVSAVSAHASHGNSGHRISPITPPEISSRKHTPPSGDKTQEQNFRSKTNSPYSQTPSRPAEPPPAHSPPQTPPQSSAQSSAAQCDPQLLPP